jgi:hypothetical protein
MPAAVWEMNGGKNLHPLSLPAVGERQRLVLNAAKSYKVLLGQSG